MISRAAVLAAAGAAALCVLVAAACGQASRPAAPAPFRIEKVASGFQRPVFVTAPRGEPGRLYVVEQAGVIRVLEQGKLRALPFLDIRSLVGSSGNEQGLLGLAFDPGYATNRRFYIDYTDRNGDTRVVAYRSDGRTALPGGTRELLFVDQPFANHNGGMLAFGPDGRLYVGMGDGGSAGDPGNRAQNPDELLGKLLRLDTSGRAKPERVAIGLRNPWRFSFDRANGDLYVGDVGQDQIEEIDYVRAGRVAGLNFGWPVYEGRASYRPGPLGPGRLVLPVAQYSHRLGCSVAGGYVYRGRAVPAARGLYFYADSCSGRVWTLRIRNGRATQVRPAPFSVASSGFGPVSFGEDAAGELYVVSLDGTIYRLRG